ALMYDGGEARAMNASYILKKLITPVCFLALASLLFGQESNQSRSAVLEGTVSVSSASGERLPGAAITLIAASPSQPPRSLVTNDQGEYKFNNLAEGFYSLKVDLAGFAPRTVQIVVRGVTTLVNTTLDLADISASVTVLTDGEHLNTSDTIPVAHFKQASLQTLPLV